MALLLLVLSCSYLSSSREVDILLKGGTIVDGTGDERFIGDIAIDSDKIVAIGNLTDYTGVKEIDVTDLIVAPGFINGLSQAFPDIWHNPLAANDVLQGITLEIIGEGKSPAPVFNMTFPWPTIEDRWNSTQEFFNLLSERKFTPNIAMRTGHTSIRQAVLGDEDVDPTDEQLQKMKDLLTQSMEEGAIGLATALMYPPAIYAKLHELIELANVTAKLGGVYASHLRSEGYEIEDAINEFINTAIYAKCPSMVFHLKVAGESNWNDMTRVLGLLETAQMFGGGVPIAANMYPYEAAQTALTVIFPPWSQEGGYPQLQNRLRDPITRDQIKEQILSKNLTFENVWNYTGGNGSNIVISKFANQSYASYSGWSLVNISLSFGIDPLDMAIRIILENPGRVETIFFIGSEKNEKEVLKFQNISYCTDGRSYNDETEAVDSHPRDFGAFAKIFRKYVREEKIISLEHAVFSATLAPAEFNKIKNRGKLTEGFFADVIVFNQSEFSDEATYASPQKFAVGMKFVFINGVVVVENGKMNGNKPGRILYGEALKTSHAVLIAVVAVASVFAVLVMGFLMIFALKACRNGPYQRIA